jgi:hypothetical protein
MAHRVFTVIAGSGVVFYGPPCIYCHCRQWCCILWPTVYLLSLQAVVLYFMAHRVFTVIAGSGVVCFQSLLLNCRLLSVVL